MSRPNRSAAGKVAGGPSPDERMSVDPGIVWLITTLALAAALLLAIGVPAVQFAFGFRFHSGELNAETRILSQQVSQVVGRNPLVWRFETLRLEELLRAGHSPGQDERRYVWDGEGDMVAAYQQQLGLLAWPVISSVASVFDSGRAVGQVEVQRSLRPLVIQTAAVALGAFAVAAALFVLLRVWPLRILRRALRRVAYLASHDPLTNLPNRRLFSEHLTRDLALAQRGQVQGVAVLCLDLDNFKDVNDTLGHHSGDALLKEAALRLRACIRESDSLARLGGDEFAIIQAGQRQPEGAAILAKRVVETLSQPFILEGHSVVVGASVGIAVYPTDGLEPAVLLQNGDTALYRAKAEGRGIYRFFEEQMQVRLQARKAMETDMRRGLAAGEFFLAYQPQIELSSGRLVGVEALLRWPHPERGLVEPIDFIPVAEESGLIVALGAWVLRTACRDALAWPLLTVAVNVSPVQFRNSDLTALVEQVLAETGLEPGRLELEITEGVLLHDTESTLATLNRLKKLGVRIAMDDFGTGYSSISYLRRFPFDKIKVDRSFVGELGGDGQAEAIVRSVVALGRSLNIRATAEGVETEAQADWLLLEGCEEVQGFHFGRPMPAAHIGWLAGTGAARADEVPPIAATG